MRVIHFQEFNKTDISPYSLIFTLTMCILIMVVKKKYLLIPLLCNLYFIPYAQRIVIAGIDFDMLRVVIIFCTFRVLGRKEYTLIKINKIDKTYFIWILCMVIIYILRKKTFGAVINRAGFVFNAVGVYLVFKIVIQNKDDVIDSLKYVLFLSIPIAICILVEYKTRKNVFFIFGGVPQYTIIREGRLRCQATFPHPILTGTFGALLFPTAWGLLMSSRKDKFLALAGFASSIIITLLSASSGPLLTLGASFFGIFMWFFQKYTSLVRRMGVITLTVLHFVMDGPVWSLLWRVTIVSGSTGYHRYALLNAFINRVKEWGPLGVNSTAHWGWGLQDVTNQFVKVGIDGGLISLIYYIVMIVLAYKKISRNCFTFGITKQEKVLFWTQGIILFSHLVSFFGVSYFGNMPFFLYSVIATISGYVLMRPKLLEYKPEEGAKQLYLQ